MIIVGTCGSGKTTLGKALSKKLGLPLVDLDELYWLPNWQRVPCFKFEKSVKLATDKKTWAVCGNYSKYQSIFLPKADTLIWLDLPFNILLFRLVKRSIAQAWTKETLCNGNRQSFRQFCWLIKHLFKTYSKRKRNYAELRHSATHLQWVHLKSSREVSQVLKTL